MAEAKPPIVIDEDGYLEVYPTVAMARRAVEGLDVIDGVYDAFDSDGRPLLLVAYGNLVAIELPPESHPDPAELERRLRDFIQSVGAARVGLTNLDDAPLQVMLEALLKFERGQDASGTELL